MPGLPDLPADPLGSSDSGLWDDLTRQLLAALRNYGVHVISGPDAVLPAFGQLGRVHVTTDTNPRKIRVDVGTAWALVFPIAQLALGTTAGTAAAGDDARLRTIGTGAGQVAAGSAHTFTGSVQASELVAGASATQTDAKFRTRGVGNALEFGHGNLSGFGSTIGASSGGIPFVAFHAEAGTTASTFRTRGIAGSLFEPTGGGGFRWSKVTGVNADDQTQETTATLDNTGLMSLRAIELAGFITIGNGSLYAPNTGLNVQKADATGSAPVTASAFTVSSDARLKTDIEPIVDALETVQALRGVEHAWTTGQEGRDYGLIAQEVQEVAPSLVSVIDPEQDDLLGVDYGRVVPILIEAIKEQAATVDKLTARIATLEKGA